MRKSFILVLAVTFIVAQGVPAFAGLKGSVDKITNGTMEVVKSPIVIYDHTKASMDSANYLAFGFFKGLVESPFHVVSKAGKGLLDIATFPIE